MITLSSPRKTLLIEQISYAEEALRNLTKQLHELFEHVEFEYKRVVEELKALEANESEIDVETFDQINQTLHDAWTNAMVTRNRLQKIDKDLNECDVTMMDVIAKLKTR
ncbi:hypothetical protein KAS14_01715 [Candidatus Bathyarchaeota archaeon]|nr:hypothetical protein [Candidatus Bathyarchaeota archaeon]